MKYFKSTIKYLIENVRLFPFTLLAILALFPLIDFSAYLQIIDSYEKGMITADFFVWWRFFTLFNDSTLLTSILSVISYIVLTLDLTFISSMVDKHVRFGSKSIRSMASGLDINIVNSFVFVLLAVVFEILMAIIMASVMATVCAIDVPLFFVVGVIICALAFAAMFMIFSLLSLWLPCLTVTGFKKLEALAYSYAIATRNKWKIFFAMTLPVEVVTGVLFIIDLILPNLVMSIVSPIVIGILFVYIVVFCYLVYVEAEGIQREDLKKY